DDREQQVLLICHRSERSEGSHKEGDPLTQGAGAGHPERDDREQQVLLICHRSERSEVKRSCESMGASSTCNDG
ncbi:MAG: hypothetical protein NC218_06845, partial [Acetobacter sp.]|nr:hypothetical protein [Acetobacter sp.]